MKEIDRDGYLETLVDSLYEQFEMYVDEDLEFFPFGSLQREDGATRRFLTYNENADVNEALSILKKGLEKNTKPIQTEEGVSIPDAMLKGGKKTLEIKDTKYQAKTKQLRIQEKFSNSNGENPVLRLPNGADVSKPLQESSFEIQFFELQVISPVDNTSLNLTFPMLNTGG